MIVRRSLRSACGRKRRQDDAPVAALALIDVMTNAAMKMSVISKTIVGAGALSMKKLA